MNDPKPPHCKPLPQKTLNKVENLKLLVKAAYPYMEYVFMNLSPKLENTELFLKHKRWLENADEVLK
jgi:hypothetical protein